MANSLLLVFSEPTAGCEDEYNNWYTHTHLDEILAIPGFISARRFAASTAQLPGALQANYLAVYEVEGDPSAALQALNEAFPQMQVSAAIDLQRSSSLMVSPIE